MSARPAVPGDTEAAKEKSKPPREGKRKEVAPTSCQPILWPKEWSWKKKDAVFKAWHALLMDRLHEIDISFRMAAIIWRFIDYRTGETSATSAAFKSKAGQCRRETVERDIDRIKALGFLVHKNETVTDRNGTIRTRRILRLAIPDEVDWKHGRVPPDDIWCDHASRTAEDTPCDLRGRTSIRTNSEEEERVDVDSDF